MPALLDHHALAQRLTRRGNAAINSTADALPNADPADPQPTFIHFSTLTLILISVAVFLVLVIVSVLVYVGRRRGKIPKFAISKPERRESARTWIEPSATADLKVLQRGLPDPPSFAGRFSYYNASGGVVSLKNVIVENVDEKGQDYEARSRDRAWLLDQNAISPVALTFSPGLPPSKDTSFSDGLSDYSRPRTRGSDIASYYFNSAKTSPALPSAPSPAYSPRDPMHPSRAGGMHTNFGHLAPSASETSVSSYGDQPLTGRLEVGRRYSRSRHRISDAPPRIPTLVGLDVFSNIGSAMMEPTSPSIMGTPIPSPQPPQPAFRPPATLATPKISSLDVDTPRSHFSPPTPVLSPVLEEPGRRSKFSFSGFYGSYGPTTPQPARAAMPRSETVGEKFKHRRFSSEVNARFAVGLGIDLSRRAGYI